jgi:hypothetical protein
MYSWHCFNANKTNKTRVIEFLKFEFFDGKMPRISKRLKRAHEIQAQKLANDIVFD